MTDARILHDAVRIAYPTAVVVHGNDVQSITATDAQGNPITIDQTVLATAITTATNNANQALADQQAAKASAISKLTALGLTSAEITAIMGS